MKTIKDEWKIFEAAMVHAEASQSQRMDMEKAFYGGALVAITMSTEISSLPDTLGVIALHMLLIDITKRLSELSALGLEAALKEGAGNGTVH